MQANLGIKKSKIINDPVYGFITVHTPLILEIIDHPYFQRLRQVKQLALTNLVYPGAHHTRFHHALGAMHLMQLALQTLIQKGIVISEDEFEAALIAILLHDIGHCPYSHALEESLFSGISHEDISLLIMKKLNAIFHNKLQLAIEMFEGKYHRNFFNQLIASQLDVDRLDYLQRDSFFTGVSEGVIGADRIIKMLFVIDNQLVVEEKGIYSVEHFISSRRIMYWQVYLHKTCVSAEKMLIGIIQRAKWLIQNGKTLDGSQNLRAFLTRNITQENYLRAPDQWLEEYLSIDDSDVWSSIKHWANHQDFVLGKLSTMLINRNLLKIKLSSKSIDNQLFNKNKLIFKQKNNLQNNEENYFYMLGELTNAAYIAGNKQILILTKSGQIKDIAKAVDLPNIKAISKIVKKYYMCWPETLYL